MKNILFISDNAGASWGGSEVLWSETAKLLSKSFKISALVTEWPSTPQPIKELQSIGVDVYFKSRKKHKIKVNPKLKFLNTKRTRTDANNAFIGKVDGWKNLDLIVISMCDSMSREILKYVELLHINNIPYVLIIQLATDLRFLRDDILIKHKTTYEKAKKVYFLSKDNALKTQMLLGCRLTNIEYIDNPFDYDSPYISFSGDKNFYSMACVANLKTFHKGQDLLIKALAQDKWRKREIRVNLYGKGPNLEQIKRLIDIYNLNDIIRLRGFEVDKTAIWKENMALILPSRMEGQSLAMLEAISLGRMVIATKVGDAERLINNGKTGYLVEHANADALEKTLEEVWQNRSNWIDMGRLARKRLFENIQQDPVNNFAEKIIALL